MTSIVTSFMPPASRFCTVARRSDANAERQAAR
jgi:hypothetical protein